MADTLPGEWRTYVHGEITRLRQSITDSVVRECELGDALRHAKPHSAQDGIIRDAIRSLVSRRTLDEIDLRRFRSLLLMTKVCPRCKGRGQKFDRRRKRWGGRTMRPCSLCRAQGALWVRP